MPSAIAHKKKKTAKKSKKRFPKIWLYSAVAFLIISLPILIYNASYFGRIFPNIIISGVNVGGKSILGATNILTEEVQPPEGIDLTYGDQNFKIKSKDIDLSYNFAATAERAFVFTRTGNILLDLFTRADLAFHPKSIGISLNFNEEKLNKIISVYSGQISVEAVSPVIQVVSGKIEVTSGKPGKEVNQRLLSALIEKHFSTLDTSPVSIPVDIIDNSLTASEKETAAVRGQKYLGKSLSLTFEYQTYSFPADKLVSFLNPARGFNSQAVDDLAAKIAKDINRDPQNPKFNFTGGRVTEFQPALDGIKLNEEDFKNKFEQSLSNIEGSDQKNFTLDIPVTRTPSEVTTDSVNNLGIRELVGRGTSTYYHSIPSRVHNIVLAAGRINGTLVKPGDTFSFNDTLGDVSQFTGYQQAYIISEGRTILGDGGGVCQVSTTLFRAALNAGVPIVERVAHAYRVGYYEQNSPPGFDATVYGPEPDFKFKNDTPGYILIEATANTRNSSLVFELYGTSDGRVASVTKPLVSDVTPPPPDLYQDDPTLPAGTVKQIDFRAWGAKVTFNYKVVRAGETLINKTFVSNYSPWQAIYLRGTAPSI